jgi:hypothetical protein
MKEILRLLQQLPPISVSVLLCVLSLPAIATPSSELVASTDAETLGTVELEETETAQPLVTEAATLRDADLEQLVSEQSLGESVPVELDIAESAPSTELPISLDIAESAPSTELPTSLDIAESAPSTESPISLDIAESAPSTELPTSLDIAESAPSTESPISLDIAESAPSAELPPTEAPVPSPVEAPDAMSQVISVNELSGIASSNSSEAQSMSQLTSVTQLSDVQPTDWAFQALQSLVERYGVIAGYPDGTYRGNRAMTRYEFAAGLNAALDRVNELIAAGLADAVTREDLATLQRLQEEFAAELATLRGRVDTLEARTAELEANQFSTTTVLLGETIFGLSSLFAGDNALGEEVDRNPVFGYRVRLNLETSFTGEDALTTRLQASNVNSISEVTLTNEGRIEYDGDSNDVFQLGLLRYRFPIGPNTNVYLAARGNGFVDLDASQQLTPYFDGSAVSLFALRNPIYNYSFGTGLGIRHFFGDRLELNLGYLVPDTSDPSPGQGLFNGKYGALAQFIVYPTDNIRVGFSYINTYSPADDEGFGVATGSNLANDNFDRPVVTNAYGISGTIDITPGLAFTGWVGYANQRYIGRGDGSVWNWAAGLAFPDLGKEGSIGGILVGMEPRLTEIDDAVNGGETDEDTSLHLEAFYKYRLTDNIEVTPGIIWLTAPDHDADNSDLVVGVLRTVFRF